MNEYNNEGHSSFMQTQPETKTVVDDLNTNISPVLAEGDEIIEMGEDFDFDGFQVVRREFFAHMREPSCSFLTAILFPASTRKGSWTTRWRLSAATLPPRKSWN